MRMNDLKRIFWWLGGGLLIGSGALVAVVFFLKPDRSRARELSLHAERQMTRARETDRGRRPEGLDFKQTYGPAFKVKIDGIRPERPADDPTPVVDEARKRECKLADLIDVVGLWTRVAFYRLERDPTHVEAVEVGGTIPARHVPELVGEAQLTRIEFEGSPFRAVFDVNGREEAFVIVPDTVGLAGAGGPRPPAAPYLGPDGPVRPLVRDIPPGSIRLDKHDGTIVIGPDAACDWKRLLEGAVWDVAPTGGIALVKITPGSGADLLNARLGGLLKEGDVVLRVGGVEAKSRAQLINHFNRNRVPAGSKLDVVIRRYGRTFTRRIVLSSE